MLARYLFFPAMGVVVWGQLRHGTMPPGVEGSDKLLHFTAYFGLALLAAVALDGRRRALLFLVGLVLLGGTMEIVQGLTGRDAEWLDQIANTIGVICGAALGYLWARIMGARGPMLAGDDVSR